MGKRHVKVTQETRYLHGTLISLEGQAAKLTTEKELDTADLEQHTFCVTRSRSPWMISEKSKQGISASKNYVQKQNWKRRGTIINYMELVVARPHHRKWFEFQMFLPRPRDGKKPFENAAFNRFSAGRRKKQWPMYAPLF